MPWWSLWRAIRWAAARIVFMKSAALCARRGSGFMWMAISSETDTRNDTFQPAIACSLKVCPAVGPLERKVSSHPPDSTLLPHRQDPLHSTAHVELREAEPSKCCHMV